MDGIEPLILGLPKSRTATKNGKNRNEMMRKITLK
jgi:hypothetical protein